LKSPTPDAADRKDASRRDALRYGALAAAGVGASAGGWAWLSYLGVHPVPTGPGYGPDPGLLDPPRQPWPRALTKLQQTTLAAAMDTVLPGDARHPAPSVLGLPAFFAEWLSAPYPDQVADRALILPMIDSLGRAGLAAKSSDARRQALEAIEQEAAFKRFVALTAGAYYTTARGAELIGFVGNAPSDRFAGPPAAVLARIDAAVDNLKISS